MTQQVTMPDGSIHEFPDGATPEQMQAALAPMSGLESAKQTAIGAGKQVVEDVGAFSSLNPVRLATHPKETMEMEKGVLEAEKKAGRGVVDFLTRGPGPYIDKAMESLGEFEHKVWDTPKTPQEAQESGRAMVKGGEALIPGAGAVADTASLAARPIERAVATSAEKIAQRGEAKTAEETAKAADKNDLIKRVKALKLKLTPQQGGGAVGRTVASAAGRPQLERSISYHNAEQSKVAAAEDVGIREPLSAGAVNREINATLPAYKAPRGLGRVNLAADEKWQSALQDIRGVSTQEQLDFPEDFNASVEKEIAKFDKPSADADTLVTKIQRLRERASDNFSGNADDKALARAQRKIATAMEEAIERHGEAIGQRGVITGFRAARQKLAKLYTLRDILTDKGDLDLGELERRWNKDEPLTGNLKTLAQAKASFDRSFQHPDKIREHRVGALDLALGALAGTGKAAAAGAVSGGAALPVAAGIAARPITRGILKSPLYQKFGIKPRVPKDSVLTRGARSVAKAGQKAGAPTLAQVEKGKALSQMTLDPALKGEEKAIQGRFAEKLASMPPDELERAYAARPDAEGGKVLSPDTMRELSEDYLKDRTKSSAVHEPASWGIKKLYARMLKRAPGPGEEPEILFTAGGTGAGKSTAISNIPEVAAARVKAQGVFDSNLQSAPKAIQKIDQALKAKKTVKIVYVWNEPAKAADAAFGRAERQAREHGTGRTVPIKEHVKTHVESNKAIREIYDHYRGDKRVKITIIDNSLGKGKATLLKGVDALPQLEYNEVDGKVRQKLEEAYREGRISDKTYEGFAGKPPPVKRAVGSGAGREPQPQRAQGQVKPHIRLKPRAPTLEDERRRASE